MKMLLKWLREAELKGACSAPSWVQPDWRVRTRVQNALIPTLYRLVSSPTLLAGLNPNLGCSDTNSVAPHLGSDPIGGSEPESGML